MTVSVLVIVEGTSPEISRCVNVEETMRLGELAQIVDAALGFTGAATHLFVGQEGSQREVYAEAPGPGEHHEDELTVAEMRPMTYVYDPAANWNIHVEVLGPSHLEGPTPMLVDAAGPDVIEACSGPELMTTFRDQARLLAAGIEPDVETITLMFSYLPVMPPERMLDRLTQADPVAVATRIGNVAEEMFFDEVAAAGEENDGPGLAQHFDDFINSRPDLLEIIDMDPHPERNPAMINAVTEFFNDVLGGGGEVADLLDIVAGVLSLFVDGTPYADGALPEEDAQRIEEMLGGVAPAATVVDMLVAGGLLKKRGGTVSTTKAADAAVNMHPDALVRIEGNLRRAFEWLMGADRWRSIVEWLVGGQPIDPAVHEWLPWLEAFAIMREAEPNKVRVTDEGTFLLHLHLSHYDTR